MGSLLIGVYLQLAHSAFLRPTEKDVHGSTRPFKALLDALLARECVAICE